MSERVTKFQTPMIIFLNKIDLFREKLEVYFKSIKVAFPAYRG